MTHRPFLAPLALLLLPFALGCADDASQEPDDAPPAHTHESILSAGIDVLEEMLAIVETVDDEASATAAAEKITVLAHEAIEIGNRAEELGEPSAEERAEVREALKPRMDDVIERFDAAWEKLEPSEKAVLEAALIPAVARINGAGK